MMPSPPALDTAEASWLRAIQPIGACTIGYVDAGMGKHAVHSFCLPRVHGSARTRS